jgi:hypothetical protein
MPTYEVTLAVTGSLTVTVDADDETAAKRRAFDTASTSLCAQCAGYTTADFEPDSDDPPYTLDLDEPVKVLTVEEKA